MEQSKKQLYNYFAEFERLLKKIKNALSKGEKVLWENLELSKITPQSGPMVWI